MDKVERVARALCATDGKNADEQIQTGGVEPQQIGEMVTMGLVWGPRWHTYRKEAGRFVAAAEALGGTITSGG